VCCKAYIVIKKHDKTTSRELLRVREVFFLNVTSCPNAPVCYFGYFLNWVANLKKGNDVLNFMGGERLHGAGDRE
jgi:hypothetical protein